MVSARAKARSWKIFLEMGVNWALVSYIDINPKQ